jgi:hypothetical protein
MMESCIYCYAPTCVPDSESLAVHPLDELPRFLWVLACTEMMRPVPQGQCPIDEPGALIHNTE